jgi:hypothetical protein
VTIYWFILGTPGLVAFYLANETRAVQLRSWFGFGFRVYFFVLMLLIGWRHEVGGDWVTYLAHIESALQQNLIEILKSPGEQAFNLVNWVSAHLGLDVYGVNLICAGIFSYGLMKFCENTQFPWLSIVIAAPYLIIVVAMGYTRQGAAIGLVMIGLVNLANGQKFKFVAWVIAGTLFHKSAFILIPLAILFGRKKWLTILGILITTLLMYTLLLAEFVDILIVNYINQEYASSGAAIRIAMNAIPSFIFLVNRKYYDLNEQQKIFWSWMSIGGLLFVILLLISPSSTAVDRVALYWIPLQIFVLSGLPVAMSKKTNSKLPWVVGILLYSMIVQFTWLLYADHRDSWLPYKFYPWQLLWN